MICSSRLFGQTDPICSNVAISPKNNEIIDESFFGQTMDGINQCNLCQNTFTTKKGLGKHIRLVHIKEQTYYCDVCTKGFGRKEHLTRHVEDMHNTFDRPFKWDKCDNCFKRKDGLAKHVRFVHDNETNFCCEICTKTNSTYFLRVFISF